MEEMLVLILNMDGHPYLAEHYMIHHIQALNSSLVVEEGVAVEISMADMADMEVMEERPFVYMLKRLLIMAQFWPMVKMGKVVQTLAPLGKFSCIGFVSCQPHYTLSQPFYLK